jgi:hypothetical protein
MFGKIESRCHGVRISSYLLEVRDARLEGSKDANSK